MKFHHIGIATENIEKTKEFIKNMMNVKEISETVYDELQDANLCMITTNEGFQIELINGKVVEGILKKRNYLYHTCYTVDNISKTIEELIKDGAFLISEEKEAKLFNNQKVAFLMCDLGIIELLENGDNL